MKYVILVDDRIVETAEGEVEARLKAEDVQRDIGRYIDDEVAGAFAVVGFAPAHDPASVSHLPPRDSVPGALVPAVFRQLK